MAQTNSLVLVAFWLPQYLFFLLTWLYWWQTKEYRLDRFFAHLRIKDGIDSLMVWWLVMKIAFLLLQSNLLILILFAFIDVKAFTAFFRKKLRRPVFTMRARNIVMVSFLVLSFAWYIQLVFGSIFLTLIFAEMTVVIGPFVGILGTTAIVLRVKAREKRDAERVLGRINPVVIGITGSFGKTTTKDFVAHLLESKYKVEKTYKNQNTEFGVFRRISTSMKPDTEFFVVEMGAYKLGEIERIASVVKPNVGIITGIEPQHLSTFGSVENIMNTKFELIRNLKNGSTAYFNSESAGSRLLFKRAKNEYVNMEIFNYGRLTKGSISIKKVIMLNKGLKVYVSEKGKRYALEVPFFSKSLLDNLLVAVMIARKYKVGWSGIMKAVRTLELPESNLTKSKTKSGLVLVDDTHNSTPSGFSSAIDVLAQIDREEKYCIATGIIELGSESAEIHKRLGKKIDKICSRVMVTNNAFLDDLKSCSEEPGKFIYLTEGKELMEIMNKTNLKKTAVLLEGRLPKEIMNTVKNI